ncbi:MAG: conjugal transfer protein TraE, partial [Caedimonadaceae bacterium]
MRPEILLSKASLLLKQRNLLLLGFGVTLGTNLILSLLVMGKSERIILVPTTSLDHRLVYEEGDFNDTYLIDWANSLLREVLTVNPETVDFQNKKFLELSLSSNLLKEKLEQLSRDIKRDHVSTVFYPKTFSIDRVVQQITVTGTFMAYFGQDKNPVVSSKTYILGYTLLPTGVIA